MKKKSKYKVVKAQTGIKPIEDPLKTSTSRLQELLKEILPMKKGLENPSETVNEEGDYTYNFSPEFQVFNALAQLTTGVANKVTDVKNTKDEYKQYLKALQPAGFSSTLEDGLNDNPIYTQYGGDVFTSQEEINQANAEARRIALTNNLVSGNDTYVARNIGDPKPKYIDSRTGKPFVSQPAKPLANTIPSTITFNDIKSFENEYWYDDPQTGDMVFVNPGAVFNKSQFKRQDSKVATDLEARQPKNFTVKGFQLGGEAAPLVEAEQGEVYTTTDGEMNKVPESGRTHEQGGEIIANVERVLEDTSDKRKDNTSKALKLSPYMAKLLADIDIKKSSSHSKVMEKAKEQNSKKLDKVQSKLNKNVDSLKNVPNNIYAKNSMDINLQSLNEIPTDSEVFDSLFDHQEFVKAALGVQVEQAKYGGSLKKYQQGGRTPITVTNPNDPRLRAYNDSLKTYNAYEAVGNYVKNLPYIDKNKTKEEREKFNKFNSQYPSGNTQPYTINEMPPIDKEVYHSDGKNRYIIAKAKKPVQPVIYQKPQEEQPPKFKPVTNPRFQGKDMSTGANPQVAAPNFQIAEYDTNKPTDFSFTYPTGAYNEQKSMYFPDEEMLRSFAGSQNTTSIQASGKGATATGNLRGMKYGGKYGIMKAQTGLDNAKKLTNITGWNFLKEENGKNYFEKDGKITVIPEQQINVVKGGNQFTVEDILKNPNKYKTFHARMAGAPEDVKRQAAQQLLLKGVMPASYSTGKEYGYTQLPPVEPNDEITDTPDYKEMEGVTLPPGTRRAPNAPYTQPKSTFNEPLNWFDVAGPISGLLEGRVPVKHNPAQLNQLRLKLQNPLPALQSGQSDYNAALKMLPQNTVGQANVANVYSKKYAIDNQILGQYENANSQIKNQEIGYNTNVRDRQSIADQSAREVTESKYLGSKEALRQQQKTSWDEIYTRLAQNKKLNREGNLLMKLFPAFDQNADFNGYKYQFRNPLNLPKKS